MSYRKITKNFCFMAGRIPYERPRFHWAGNSRYPGLWATARLGWGWVHFSKLNRAVEDA